MRIFDITLSARVVIPDDVTLIEDIAGNTVAFEDAKGNVLKPWIAWELQRGETYRDITEKALDELGFKGFEHGDRDITFAGDTE